MKCKGCGMEVDRNSFKRCPRCNTVIDLPMKCTECKGCSLFSGGNKDIQQCQSKDKISA